MGILDDAIREHLDLKRRLGAEEQEIERLEGEAFGPPSRPGDPDFPEEQAGAGASAETAVAEQPTSEEAAVEQPELSEPPVEAEEAPEAETEPAGGAFYDQSSDELALDVSLDEPPPAPAAPEAAEPEPIPEAATPRPVEEASPPPVSEPPSEPVTDDQPAVEPTPTPVPEEPPIESLDTVEHTPDFEPPIESMDTVEHHFEDAIEDTGEADAVQPPPAEDTGEVEVVEGELEEPEEDEGEDVLEETPEFLRDQPEDDELWFEQGEPKDFDF